MSDAEFYEPYLAKWRTPILDCALRPLSLGHLLLLHSLDSAFLSGKTPTFDDLAASIFVCCNTYQNALDSIGSRKLERAMHKWAKKLGHFDFTAACSQFIDYLEVGLREPRYRVAGGGSGKGTIPKVQSVKVFLMANLGFRESEILDRPWRLCVLDYMTALANDGNLEFVDKEYQDLVKSVSRMTPEELEAACKKERNGTA